MGVLLLGMTVVVQGCGLSLGGVPSGADRAMHASFYPAVRSVAHPDSVQNIDQAFDVIEREWSVGYRDISDARMFRTGSYGTFATFWSKEVSLSWIGYRADRENLSEQVALQLADEAADTYASLVKIVVHTFMSEVYRNAYQLTDLSYPGTQVDLIDEAGNLYSSMVVQSGDLQVVRRYPSEPAAYYRENAVYFLREVDGRDILEDVEELQLYVRVTDRVPARMRFTWRITRPDSDETARGRHG